jgi:hypothetical protein
MSLKFKRTTAASLRLHRVVSGLLAVALISTPLLCVNASRTTASARSQKQQQSQTTVRGKLVRNLKGQQRAAAYVMVTLQSYDKEQRTVPVYTDAKGMYYIYAARGKYILEIWGTQKEVIMSFYIEVPDKPYFDVAPITVP